MVSIKPRLSSEETGQQQEETQNDESNSTSNRLDSQEPQVNSLGSNQHNNSEAETSRLDSLSPPGSNSSPVESGTQRASQSSNNSANSNEAIEVVSAGAAAHVPTTATGFAAPSIAFLPPVYSAHANDEISASDLDEENSPSPQTAQVTRASSQRGDGTLAVAEIVNQRSTSSFGDFGDDVEDQIEDRAYQIARRVLNEIRQNAVDADEMITVTAAGDASATVATETQEQQIPKLETQANKDLLSASVPVQRRRIFVLMGLVAVLFVVVIVLVVILATRSDNSSSAVDSSTSVPAGSSSKCSFCAGGSSSTYSLDDLRKIPVGSSPTFPTCGDIYLYQQTLSSTDSSCPVLQALAFYYYCGCQTVPARPKNASCTACPNGGIAKGSLYCAKVDTVVSVVGSSLFFFENCAQLANTELQKYGCTCPLVNATST